ncbi:xanthine dehydrogenase family protein molybdopterin-binding subunit [Lacibacterium aquatile]|uniref:Xanthine dehydrogenase family protein molybdopterin-binding subunit n=1 Tax=Lacibacterium aquatile TaxID=1168082 RepID=A0ABW5DN50_9PROT
MGQFGMGQPVRRVEDVRLVTGAGRYTDDIAPANTAAALVVRSPYAHAHIRAIDTSGAMAVEGALAVYTAADIAHLGTIPSPIDIPGPGGRPMARPLRPLLAREKVVHVGEAVAFVVAETVEAARDMAEALFVDYDDLPAVADMRVAISGSAAQIHEGAPDNISFVWTLGDKPKTEAAFAKARHVVEVDIVNQRLVSSAMEPRNAIGEWDGTRFTLTTTSQGVHGLQKTFATIMGVEPAKMRVMTPDVGGGFGTKLFPYPEHGLVLHAAKELGRPVKWIGERPDSFLGDAHGRDNLTAARLALDENGRILGLDIDTLANLGALISPYGPFVATMAGCGMLCGVYDIPAAHVHVTGVFTNTVPVDAYRGAGRPEAAYVIERLMDEAAVQIGLSPAEIRRRNFIRPEQMPYTTALEQTYDSGEFQQNLEDALVRGDAAGFEARRAQSAAKGKLRGIGLSTYIEACAGGSAEVARLVVNDTGKITILIGTQSNGQGHETAYAQLAADRLGLTPDDIEVVQGDTDRIATGGGTGGSRSVPVGGASVDQASVGLIEKGKQLAAHYLEAAAADIEFADARFTIAGTDRSISWVDVAARAAGGDLPDGDKGFEASSSFKPPASTYPNGCHLVEVEIDPETGGTEVLRYTIVDDFGTIVNPLLLAGQVHGGVAQGLGQALMESIVYDENGQLLTGSFTDYAMPRADDLPHIDFTTNSVPCTTNPLGVKGAGEAGTIGATPAVMNAVMDALRSKGVQNLHMPATPAKVWQALQSAAA